MGDVDRARLEVDVAPAEAERLALAQAERERHRIERLEAIATPRGEERASFVDREEPCLVVGHARRFGELGHVARHEAVAEGAAEGVAQDRAHVVHRSRREAGAELRLHQRVHVPGGDDAPFDDQHRATLPPGRMLAPANIGSEPGPATRGSRKVNLPATARCDTALGPAARLPRR